MKQKSGKKP